MHRTGRAFYSKLSKPGDETPPAGEESVRDATWFSHTQMCFQSSPLALPAGFSISKRRMMISFIRFLRLP